MPEELSRQAFATNAIIDALGILRRWYIRWIPGVAAAISKLESAAAATMPTP